MKKTFVKALSVILSALMLLASFTACDGGKDPADTGTEAPASAAVPATDAPTEAPTEPETEAPVTDLFVVRDGSSYKIGCDPYELPPSYAMILREYVCKSTGVTAELLTDASAGVPDGAVILIEKLDAGMAADVTQAAGH